MPECKRQTSKKYTSRPSPPYSAAHCPGVATNGNDGNTYVSVPNKNGVHRWVIAKAHVVSAALPELKPRNNGHAGLHVNDVVLRRWRASPESMERGLHRFTKAQLHHFLAAKLGRAYVPDLSKEQQVRLIMQSRAAALAALV